MLNRGAKDGDFVVIVQCAGCSDCRVWNISKRFHWLVDVFFISNNSAEASVYVCRLLFFLHSTLGTLKYNLGIIRRYWFSETRRERNILKKAWMHDEINKVTVCLHNVREESILNDDMSLAYKTVVFFFFAILAFGFDKRSPSLRINQYFRKLRFKSWTESQRIVFFIYL